MKKYLLLLIALSAFAFISCNSSQKFLKDYETFVAEVETAVKEKDSHKLDFFETQQKDFENKYKEFSKKGDFSKEEDEKYLTLESRYSSLILKLELYKVGNSINRTLKNLGSAFSEELNNLEKDFDALKENLNGYEEDLTKTLKL